MSTNILYKVNKEVLYIIRRYQSFPSMQTLLGDQNNYFRMCSGVVLYRADQKILSVFLVNLFQNSNTPKDFNVDLNKEELNIFVKKILSQLRNVRSIGVQMVCDSVSDYKH